MANAHTETPRRGYLLPAAGASSVSRLVAPTAALPAATSMYPFATSQSVLASPSVVLQFSTRASPLQFACFHQLTSYLKGKEKSQKFLCAECSANVVQQLVNTFRTGNKE
jgi:hypothetical protein